VPNRGALDRTAESWPTNRGTTSTTGVNPRPRG